MSPRSVLAASLGLIALVPPALFVVHLSSPLEAVRLTHTSASWLASGAWIAAGLLLVLLVLYPPFLPGARLALSRTKRRLSVERIAMLDSLERLRHHENAHDHLIVGRSLVAQGQLPRAITHIARAIELEPDGLPARYLLGTTLAALRRWGPAAEQLLLVVARDPSHGYGDALLRLGEALLRVQKEQDAVRVLQQRIERHGKNREALVLLAQAQARLGAKEQAIATLRDASRPLDAAERPQPQNAYWRAKARVALWWARRPA